MIKIFESDFCSKEEQAVQDVISSGWLTNGNVTIEFEKIIQNVLLQDQCNAVVVSSATAALHLGLIASNIGPGDEVIVPALNFVSDYNVVKAVGAKPILCDVDSIYNWTPNLQNIKEVTSSKTKCCFIVHFAGIPCKDIFEIREFCQSKSIVLIEDVAHAAGASVNGQMCGSIGDFGAFSFYSNKNIATGEGGCISASKNIDKLKRLRSHGMSASTLDREKGRIFSYDVLEYGLNYRIDEIRSAIGIEQIKKFDQKHSKRRELVLAYLEHLPKKIITPFSTAVKNSEIVSVDHIMPVLLPVNVDKKSIIKEFLDNEVQTTMHYPAPWSFSAYSEEFSDISPCSVSEEIISREITLPLHPKMSINDVKKICKVLNNFLMHNEVA
tara:strand:+ start:510 stop:1658 length:1149 start_codon:yes stop_codon:yes gene_type:complete